MTLLSTPPLLLLLRLLLLLLHSSTSIQSIAVPIRQYVPGLRNITTPATSLITELDNQWIHSTLTLHSDHRTALIIVDVWNDQSLPSLYENQNLRLLPLLAFGRSQNWLIVHAPSEHNETTMIEVLPNEILVTGLNGSQHSTSLCYPHLFKNSVEKVLVAGYDTNFCMLVKK